MGHRRSAARPRFRRLHRVGQPPARCLVQFDAASRHSAAEPGQYRIIVRPDIYNEVYEAEFEANNRTASEHLLTITVPEVHLNVPFETTLSTGQERLFQFDAPLGATVRVSLSSERDGFNELFVRFGQVADQYRLRCRRRGSARDRSRCCHPLNQTGHLLLS